jgi:hypothetical protein
MSTRTFARIYGIVFLAVGILGFVPGITTPHTHPDVALDAGLGLLLGLFAINVLHNVVHLIFGAWGLVAARSLPAAKLYFKATAIIYAVFTVMGLVSAANLYTTFGLVPLYGNDVWLHALLAAVAAYFGFVHRDVETRSRVGATR